MIYRIHLSAVYWTKCTKWKKVGTLPSTLLIKLLNHSFLWNWKQLTLTSTPPSPHLPHTHTQTHERENKNKSCKESWHSTITDLTSSPCYQNLSSNSKLTSRKIVTFYHSGLLQATQSWYATGETKGHVINARLRRTAGASPPTQHVT